MNLLHEQLIDILTVLDVVCTKSRLRWYLTGGRLLGPLETVNSYVDFRQAYISAVCVQDFRRGVLVVLSLSWCYCSICWLF